jgi:hypothetical protein
MSHIVEVSAEVRDPDALAAACRRLGLPEPVSGTAQLFRRRATGLLVRLPGWAYPVVFDTHAGTVRFDNFQGRWGDRIQLDRLLQAHAVERLLLEARRRGRHVLERPQADGSIRLTIRL